MLVATTLVRVDLLVSRFLVPVQLTHVHVHRVTQELSVKLVSFYVTTLSLIFLIYLIVQIKYSINVMCYICINHFMFLKQTFSKLTVLNACSNNACQNGAGCVQISGSCTAYTCSCPNCYTGQFCETCEFLSHICLRPSVYLIVQIKYDKS